MLVSPIAQSLSGVLANSTQARELYLNLARLPHDHQWQVPALEALQEAAEAYLVEIFDLTQTMAIHAARDPDCTITVVCGWISLLLEGSDADAGLTLTERHGLGREDLQNDAQLSLVVRL